MGTMSSIGRRPSCQKLQLILCLLFLTARLVTEATSLLPGTFFKVPGTDATFDYVVSHPRSQRDTFKNQHY